MFQEGGVDLKDFQYCFIVGYTFHGFLIDGDAVEPVIYLRDEKFG